jgi:hypothetical protein
MDTQKQQCEVTRGMLGGADFSAVSFQPHSKGNSVLCIATMDNRLHRVHVEDGRVEHVPADARLAGQKDRVIGLSFDPSDPKVVLLWGRTFISKQRLDGGPLDARQQEATAQLAQAGPVSGSASHKQLTRYRPIVHMEMVGKGEMMVLEAPWLQVMKTFQNPLARKRFGGAS